MNAAKAAQLIASCSLIALIFLCLLWETVLAPIRPVGSLLMLKAVPLLVPLFGILHGKLYTYRWTALMALVYFCEGVVRAWSDAPPSQWNAAIEIVLALTLSSSCVWYVHSLRNHRRNKINAS